MRARPRKIVEEVEALDRERNPFRIEHAREVSDHRPAARLPADPVHGSELDVPQEEVREVQVSSGAAV